MSSFAWAERLCHLLEEVSADRLGVIVDIVPRGRSSLGRARRHAAIVAVTIAQTRKPGAYVE